VASLGIITTIGMPFVARAGVFSFVSSLFGNITKAAQISADNSQSISLLQADIKPGSDLPSGGAEITIIDGTALASDASPLSSEDHDASHRPGSDQISIYVVRAGETISQIATMFNVSVNTIVWTNNLKTKDVHEGQVLIILPISGVKYSVKAGDTIESIAKAYKGDATEIKNYNNLSDNAVLATGTEIIIPDGEIAAVVPVIIKKPVVKSPKSSIGGPQHAAALPDVAVTEGDTTGYYMRPLLGGIKTQGIHGYNAVDIGTPVGSTVYAAASGSVIISRDSGWNGGYGEYIVIAHSNGTQTLYAHLSGTIVVEGQSVVQGQVLGYSGSTGKSTGPHLHFEVRGAVNPF